MSAIKSQNYLGLIIWGLALVFFLGACQKSPTDSICRAPYEKNEDAAARLWNRLKSASEGANIANRLASKPAICFGEIDHSVVTTDGIVMLDKRLDDHENAARLGHLSLHIIEGNPLDAADAGDCEARVEKALQVEAGALALELRLRREFGVNRKTYEFEEKFWKIEAEKREAFILDYLQKHPEGAPGIDALGIGYAEQCRDGKL